MSQDGTPYSRQNLEIGLSPECQNISYKFNQSKLAGMVSTSVLSASKIVRSILCAISRVISTFGLRIRLDLSGRKNKSNQTLFNYLASTAAQISKLKCVQLKKVEDGKGMKLQLKSNRMRSFATKALCQANIMDHFLSSELNYRRVLFC